MQMWPQASGKSPSTKWVTSHTRPATANTSSAHACACTRQFLCRLTQAAEGLYADNCDLKVRTRVNPHFYYCCLNHEVALSHLLSQWQDESSWARDWWKMANSLFFQDFGYFPTPWARAGSLSKMLNVSEMGDFTECSGPFLGRASWWATPCVCSHKLRAFDGCCRTEVVINTKLLSVTK